MLTRRDKCRICDSKDLVSVLNLGNQPPANAFLSRAEFNKERSYPLNVHFCNSCGLVQLLDVVSPEVLFRNYVYVSSTSPSFVAHFESYAQTIASRFDVKGQLAIDLGSNDGVLLKPLKARGAMVLGIDPATEIARRATAEGIETLPEFFTPVLAEKIVAERGKAKVITANNVFAHIDDVKSVLAGVKTLLADDGALIVEVPYLADFLEKKLFDTVYHEHLSYFAVGTLAKLMADSGFNIFDVERVGSHGGSIRVFIQKKGGPHAVTATVGNLLSKEKELGLGRLATYQNFAREVGNNKAKLTKLLADLKGQNKKIAAYGAPAKGNTLLNYAGINSSTLDYIVDDSEYKQGLYAPGSHVPVVSYVHLQNNKPDYLFILAWNFAEPIMKKCSEFQRQGGEFILPVPEPKII